MLRSLSTLSLLALVLTGCNQPADQISLVGPAADRSASDATTLPTEAPPPDTQRVMEAHGPTAAADPAIAPPATTDPATRVLQKPVMTHAAEEHGDDHDEHHADEPKIENAVCVLLAVGDSGVSGTIHFDVTGDSLHVTGTVNGLSPGKHGFHIHEFGDLRDAEKGLSTGGHFNPTGAQHGHREGEDRHAGDFGNIEAGEDGVAKIDFEDKIASINGDHSIVGHGVVVHADEDKFTQPSGDAGARVAIGVVGVANPEQSK